MSLMLFYVIMDYSGIQMKILLKQLYGFFVLDAGSIEFHVFKEVYHLKCSFSFIACPIKASPV